MSHKLTDLQRVLLSTACQREGGSLLPTAENVRGKPASVRSAITSLLKRELVEETEAASAAQAWRETDERRIGIAITDAGRSAIGCGTPAADQPSAAHDGAAPAVSTAASSPVEPRSTSKSAQVVALLQRENGATLAELAAATGWLPHTTHAALTGLRKKGHEIEKRKRGEATCYHIAAAA